MNGRISGMQTEAAPTEVCSGVSIENALIARFALADTAQSA